MDKLKQQHLNFIKANPFEFAMDLHGFSEGEVFFIEKYGNWLHALVRNELEPVSEKQKQFIKEMKSRESPTFEYVVLWKRYLRREIEAKDVRGVMKAPPPKLEDDPFYSREGAKELRKGQFKTITEQHRK